MELPVVNHPEYVAEINENSIFPIKKFSALAKYLLQNNIVKKFHIPKECSLETLSKLALDFKLSCNTAGGSHHAGYDYGSGYCVFNDVAVAANYIKLKKKVKKILILDLDVHQGNGNSEIFKNDKNIFTFSMHCKSNFPAKKSISDLDIEL